MGQRAGDPPRRAQNDNPRQGRVRRMRRLATRRVGRARCREVRGLCGSKGAPAPDRRNKVECTSRDRKSTRLNSSHLVISYAVFCLKKKNRKKSSSSASRQNA